MFFRRSLFKRVVLALLYGQSFCACGSNKFVCRFSILCRELLDYKERVCKYWPEFEANNKQDISIEMLLCHRVFEFYSLLVSNLSSLQCILTIAF